DRRGVAARDRGGDPRTGDRTLAPTGGGTLVKFGSFAPGEALGGIVVHSIRKDGLVLKKGTRIGKAESEALIRAGIGAITVARLEAGDVSEDEAAGEIAAAVAGEAVRVDPAFT